jgi:Methyltransferase domain
LISIFNRYREAKSAPLSSVKIRSLAAFQDIYSRWDQYREPGSDILVPMESGSFSVPGYCWVDQQPVDFNMDSQNSHQEGDALLLNWRERLICPMCGLNSRQRSAIHLLDEVVRLKANARIWITEQVTPLCRKMMEKFRNTVGSEYLGNDVVSGVVNQQGIRHEDVTQTAFGTNSLDAVLSFDVMEHVPEYKKAFFYLPFRFYIVKRIPKSALV